MQEIFPAAVYLMCFGACLLCTYLLARSYLRNRARLLLWSGLCFGLLACNSLLVILDILIFPSVDFSLIRSILSLAAVAVLLFGFIWDLEE